MYDRNIGLLFARRLYEFTQMTREPMMLKKGRRSRRNETGVTESDFNFSILKICYINYILHIDRVAYRSNNQKFWEELITYFP
jgi:hypothetical protein